MEVILRTSSTAVSTMDPVYCLGGIAEFRPWCYQISHWRSAQPKADYKETKDI